MAKRPLIVSIIAILVLLSAIFEILLGAILIILGIIGGSVVGSSCTLPACESIASVLVPIIIIAGVVMLLLGIFYIFVFRGLWKGRNWARIFYIVVGIIGIIGNIFAMLISPSASSIITGIIGMILPILIISYLLFSRKVKNYFR